MAYDHETPYGTTHGNLSPLDQLQAETLARLHAQQATDGARETQMRALREMSGGQAQTTGEGGPFAGDSFFNEPKAGPSYLDQHNSMVDRREQATAGLRDQLDLLKPPDYLTGTDHGDLARAQLGLDKGQMGIQQGAQDALRGLLGGGSASTSPAGMNPNALPGGPDPHSLFGGGAGGGDAAGAGAAGSDDNLLRMAILGGLAGGGKMPDVGGIINQRGEMTLKKQEHDVQMQMLQMQMEEARRKMAEDADTRRLGRSPNMRVDDFLSQNPAMSAAVTSSAQHFAKDDTAMFGRDPSPRAMSALLGERDNLVHSLTDRGYPADVARQQANLAIRRAVEPYANDLNAGQIQKLLQALDDGAAATTIAPAVPSGGDLSPFNGTMDPKVKKAITGAFPPGALGYAQ